MKRAITFGLLTIALFAFVGCDDDDAVYDPKPQPPQGVFSVTGDGEVELWWAGPYDRDVRAFRVFRATSPDDQPPTNYTELFTVDADDNPNLNLIWYSVIDDAVTNGVTYWYAISSIDHAGQESDLSAEDIFDTPRPEGVVSLYDFRVNVNSSGFDFTTKAHVSAGSGAADVWVDEFDGVFYLNAGDTLGTRNTDIQDMGFTSDWDAIGYAPLEGWSNLGYTELIEGHTYVIWTEDNHFVKMRVISSSAVQGWVQFQWAWQPQPGNPELIVRPPVAHPPVPKSGASATATGSK